MSSILDALDKLDTATTPVGGTLRAVHLPRRQRSLGTVVALTAAAVVAGAAFVGIASWSSSSSETAVSAPVETAAVAPAATNAPVAAVAPSPPVAAGAPGAAVTPSARVAAGASVAPAAPRPLRTPAPVPAPRGSAAQHAALAAPRAGVADDEVPWAEPAPTAEDPLSVTLEREPMPRLAMARVAPREPVVSDVEPYDYPAPERVAPLEPEEPVAAPPARSRPPAGAPSVRLSFLMYSSSPERRTVALKVGEGALASLHEGESVDGFQVVQIHRDHAELVFGGERFGLWPRN